MCLDRCTSGANPCNDRDEAFHFLLNKERQHEMRSNVSRIPLSYTVIIA